MLYWSTALFDSADTPVLTTNKGVLDESDTNRPTHNCSRDAPQKLAEWVNTYIRISCVIGIAMTYHRHHISSDRVTTISKISTYLLTNSK